MSGLRSAPMAERDDAAAYETPVAEDITDETAAAGAATEIEDADSETRRAGLWRRIRWSRVAAFGLLPGTAMGAAIFSPSSTRRCFVSDQPGGTADYPPPVPVGG